MADPYQTDSLFQFKGWIPTVAGHLTFDRFGHTLFPSKSVGASIGKGRKRAAFCFQRRVLKDGVIPEPLLRFQYNRHSKFCYAAAAVVDAADCLAGFVYVFSYTVGPEESRWASVRPRINDPERGDALIQKMRGQSYGDPDAWWQDFMKNHHGFLQRNALFACEFTIERCGIVSISIAQPVLTERLSFAGEDEMLDCASDLASQVFFFLRDVTHTHQHHPETNDTMTDVYRVPANDTQFTWLKETAYELFRFVIRYKQHRNLQYCISGKGVLAYLSSLTSLIGSKVPNWKAAYDLDRVRDSIDVKIQEFDYALRKRIHAVTAALSPTIATLAIVVACANLVKQSGVPTQRHQILQEIDQLTGAGFPWLLATLLLLAMLLHFLIWGADGVPSACREVTLLAVARLQQNVRRHRAILLSFVLALIFTAGALMVLIGFGW